MANRRMFSLDVVDTDTFLDMPASSQNLYFHLGMRADDDGFVSAPKKIAKMVNCGQDDLNLLIAKGYLIPFDDGVVVIKDWNRNNYIKADRYKETLYQADKSMLAIENGAYELEPNCIQTGTKLEPECIQIGAKLEPIRNQTGTKLEPNWNQTGTKLEPECIQDDSKMETQVSIGKDSIGKDSIGKDSIGKGSKGEVRGGKPDSQTLFDELSPFYGFSDEMTAKIRSWIKYKTERRESYKEQGMKSLLSQIKKHIEESGEEAVSELIDESMANGWKGIIWDRLSHKSKKTLNDIWRDV